MNTEQTIKINREQKKDVDKHIENVFITLQKKKTRPILAAFYHWYKSKPEIQSTELIEFDVIARKNSDDVEQKSPKSVKNVYGDKYAIILTKFVRANHLHEVALINILIELVDLSKFEGRGNLGFAKLLNKDEISLIKDIFRLLKSNSGICVVTAVGKEINGLVNIKQPIIKSEKSSHVWPIGFPPVSTASHNDTKVKTISSVSPTGFAYLAKQKPLEAYNYFGKHSDEVIDSNCKVEQNKKTKDSTNAKANEKVIYKVPKDLVDDVETKTSHLAKTIELLRILD